METSALRTLWTECFGNEDGWIDTFLKTAFDPSRVCALSCEGRLPGARMRGLRAFRRRGDAQAVLRLEAFLAGSGLGLAACVGV